MKFSYNFLNELTTKKLPPAQDLADLFTMHSFEVEGVEKSKDDFIFDIDILPNRAHDAASHTGVAREAVALNGGKLKEKTLPDIKRKKSSISELKVDVQRKAWCPRYMAAIMRDVDVKESPSWLKNRLEALGINSINNIVDAANYVMLETGQPLHAFDYDKIEGKKIVVRAARKGENIQSLDSEQYLLEDSILVIADEKDPIAVAGVKGGKKAEVTKDTKNIVLESANFDPLVIRQATRVLGLTTDASWRFEHEAPMSFTDDGIRRLIDVVGEIAGGKAEKEVIDTLSKPIAKTVISISPDYVEKLLGMRIPKNKIKSILSSLGFEAEERKNDLKVGVPDFRLDVKREEDLVEEVGKIFGYENISPKMPNAALYPPKRNPQEEWTRNMRKHITSRGFHEIYSYSFISDKDLNNIGVKESSVWEAANPVSSEFRYLRPSLLPGILKAASKNLRFFDRVPLFEIGEIFKNTKNKREEPRLALSLGVKKDAGNEFYTLKGEVVGFMHSLGLTDIWFDDALKEKEKQELQFLHSTRRAQVKRGNTTLGYIGQVSPKVAKQEGIKGSVFVADFSLQTIIENAEEEEEYTPVSDYPHAVRDISVIVPFYTKANEVIRTINTAGGKILRDVDMFDYYEEAKGGEQKSMAFHVVFQASDRTLTAREIEDKMAKITHNLNQHKGWIVKE